MTEYDEGGGGGRVEMTSFVNDPQKGWRSQMTVWAMF